MEDLQFNVEYSRRLMDHMIHGTIHGVPYSTEQMNKLIFQTDPSLIATIHSPSLTPNPPTQHPLSNEPTGVQGINVLTQGAKKPILPAVFVSVLFGRGSICCCGNPVQFKNLVGTTARVCVCFDAGREVATYRDNFVAVATL
uniref:Uncharacterized protein n=1 Tax=Timema poppense TaxID=170557 RepID=A0A7R9H5M0_TIMPO|nr:unnamed protein product [Timema poppensis]